MAWPTATLQQVMSVVLKASLKLVNKVEAVKISSCSYLETRFPPTIKICRESKLEKKHKTYFFEIFLYDIEYFL
jgi:hypothetical protein